jgi:hypothetical protein
MVDGQDVDTPAWLVDAVHDPVVPAMGAVRLALPDSPSGPRRARPARSRRSISASASCFVIGVLRPAATSVSASWMAASNSGSLRIASVSSSDSRSSRLSMTAAGRPCLVMTTRPCSCSRPHGRRGSPSSQTGWGNELLCPGRPDVATSAPSLGVRGRRAVVEWARVRRAWMAAARWRGAGFASQGWPST